MCGESLGHVEVPISTIIYIISTIVDNIIVKAIVLSFLPFFQGKYKLAMMRGEHTPSVRHFKTMDNSISEDLNNWLCNIYFEIKHLPLSSIEQANMVC